MIFLSVLSQFQSVMRQLIIHFVDICNTVKVVVLQCKTSNGEV